MQTLMLVKSLRALRRVELGEVHDVDRALLPFVDQLLQRLAQRRLRVAELQRHRAVGRA